MMPAKEGGIKARYNVQTAVDASSHMIVDFDVTNNSSDRGTIDPTIEKCKREIGLESVRVIADKGYESLADIEQCLLHGTAADVGFIQDRDEIPANGISSKSLNSFGKLPRAEKRVMIFIRRDIPKQKQRQQTSEHPFGTIKHYDRAGYFLCRGKEKVTAEYALSALSYNLRRTVALCGGVQKLIERCRSIAMPKIRKIAES